MGDRADALYESVWQRDPQGNFIVFENNGRPIEDPFKRVIGYAGADWEFGISSTLRYRNWSLSFDIAGRVGGVIRSDLNARMIEAGTHKLTAAPERELDWTKTPSYIPSNAVVVVDGDIEYDDHGNVLYDTRGYAPSTTPVYFKSWIGYMGKLNGPYTMGYNLSRAISSNSARCPSATIFRICSPAAGFSRGLNFPLSAPTCSSGRSSTTKTPMRLTRISPIRPNA